MPSIVASLARLETTGFLKDRETSQRRNITAKRMLASAALIDPNFKNFSRNVRAFEMVSSVPMAMAVAM